MSEVFERKRLKTGMCLAGWHEGSRPRTREGKAIRTCEFISDCPCDCHAEMDQMFIDLGKPRECVINPDYVPVTSNVLQYITIAAPSLFDPDSTGVSQALISVAPGVTPGHKRRDFPPTPSGRLARGQADYLTLSATDYWAVELAEIGDANRIEPCTAQYISDLVYVQTQLHIDVSTVIAVLHRWEKIGFAYVMENPVRFVGYTTEAIEKGFEWIQDKFDRQKELNAFTKR